MCVMTWRAISISPYMEGARDTLQEAAGLAELMASVEDVFATGNIRQMADTLASMRRGLKVRRCKLTPA